MRSTRNPARNFQSLRKRRREKIGAIADSVAKHSARELEVLAEWEPATARLPRMRTGERRMQK